MKRQGTNWEKIFSSHISNKDINPEYTESPLSSKGKKNPIIKWVKDLNLYWGGYKNGGEAHETMFKMITH